MQSVAETAKTMLESPPLVSVNRTVYDLGPVVWGPTSFSLGLADGKPVVAFRAPDGLRLAAATKPVPQSDADWQQFVLESNSKPLFVSVVSAGPAAFVSYQTGRRDERQRWLASCPGGDLANPASWSKEELTGQLDFLFIWSISAFDGRLWLLCKTDKDRQVLYSREIGVPGASWTSAAHEALQGEFCDAELLFVNGAPAVAFMLKDRSQLWLASPQGDGEWSRSGVLANTSQIDLGMFGRSFTSQDSAVAMAFSHGEPAEFQFAVCADATASKPEWTVSDLISWEMEGDTDVTFVGDNPVVAFAPDTGIFAFFADTDRPRGSKDWVMCQLCDDLGAFGYNGIAAQVVDGHLLAAYIAQDLQSAQGAITLGVTVIETP